MESVSEDMLKKQMLEVLFERDYLYSMNNRQSGRSRRRYYMKIKRLVLGLLVGLIVFPGVRVYAYNGVGEVSEKEISFWMEPNYTNNYVGKAKKATRRIKEVKEYTGIPGEKEYPGTIYTYKYDKKGNVVKISQKSDNSSYKSTTKYKYDKEGNLVKDELYSGDELINWHKYQTDDEGRVVEAEFGSRAGNSSTTTYTYGKKKIKVVTGTGSVKTYKLDKNGNIVHQTIDSNPTEMWYTYDKDGRLTHKKESLTTGVFTEDLEYDAEGYLSKSTRTLSNGGYIRREYVYESIPSGK